MSFSNPVPPMASLPSLTALSRYSCADPTLSEAWTLTRQLRRLEFTWKEAPFWLRAARALAVAIQRELTHHIVEAERDSSLPRRLSESGHTGARTHLEEHGELAAAADALVRECGTPIVPDIWTLVEVAEKAILLETLIARHAHRLDQLVRSNGGSASNVRALDLEPLR